MAGKSPIKPHSSFETLLELAATFFGPVNIGGLPTGKPVPTCVQELGTGFPLHSNNWEQASPLRVVSELCGQSFQDWGSADGFAVVLHPPRFAIRSAGLVLPYPAHR